MGIRFLSVFAALALAACGGSGAAHVESPTPPVRTCLVLSVGGAKGIAHLGAIAATKQLGIPIQCVVGNSMGALVGSLYATAPTLDTSQRYRGLMADYAATTRAEAENSSVLGGLLLGGLVLLSGGAALPVLAGGAGGAMLGADSVDQVNLDRFRTVLDRYYGGAYVERLPVPFATMHQEVLTDGGGMVDVRAGNVAAAVGASIANPLIFPKLDVRKTGMLDPGVDRVAVTPVDDACRMFPNSRLIAVNVTAKPVFVSNRMKCPVIEIDVPYIYANATRVLAGEDPDFSTVVTAGYRAALVALAR